MSEKWADYGISEVRYNNEHTHIDEVKVHADKGDSIGSSSVWTREEVIKQIKANKTFVTIVKNSNGKWSKGQPVYIITVNGTEYIKTVDNGKESDNLENLPEF